MQAFHHDLYRAMNKGRWWVMEQQPGPVNWAPYNPAPLPGMVRLWSWEAFAHGAEVVSYFRWRQASFAQEQMHAGLLRPDDVPADGLAEAQQVAEEMATLPDVAPRQAPVALIFDYASDWAWKTLPQGADFDYFRLVFDAYTALRRKGLSVDILPPTARDFEGYQLILAPGIAHLPELLTTAMQTCQARCLIGPRSNLVTDELSLNVPLGPSLPDLDTQVVRVESLPPGIRRTATGGGAVVHWAESLEGSAEIALTYQDGTPLVVQAGNLQYLSGWPDTELWDRIISVMAKTVNLELHDLPKGLRLRDTGAHRFAFNYGPGPVVWQDQDIPAAGVAWWET
jgi:beta-galactosidase